MPDLAGATEAANVPFGEAIGLLLYLVPGFLARQLFRAHYPASVCLSLRASSGASFHSLIILLGLTGIAWVFDCDDLDILKPSQNSLIQSKTILILLIGGFVWGGILIGYHRFLTIISFLPSPEPQAIWPVIATRAPKKELWMLVRTKQGALYLGWLEQYS